MERAPQLGLAFQEEEYRNPNRFVDIDMNTLSPIWGSHVQLEVLGDILDGIEERVPSSFDSLDALRALLLEIGRTPSALGTFPFDEAEQREEAAERDRFCAYVESLTADDLLNVEPLPYRLNLIKRAWPDWQENLRTRHLSYGPSDPS